MVHAMASKDNTRNSEDEMDRPPPSEALRRQGIHPHPGPTGRPDDDSGDWADELLTATAGGTDAGPDGGAGVLSVGGV